MTLYKFRIIIFILASMLIKLAGGNLRFYLGLFVLIYFVF